MTIEPKFKKAGTFTVAFGGVAATLTAENAREWLELGSQYAPLLLSVWLLYTLYRMENDHRECRKRIAELNKELTSVKDRLNGVEISKHLNSNEGGNNS